MLIESYKLAVIFPICYRSISESSTSLKLAAFWCKPELNWEVELEVGVIDAEGSLIFLVGFRPLHSTLTALLDATNDHVYV